MNCHKNVHMHIIIKKKFKKIKEIKLLLKILVIFTFNFN